MKPASKFKAFVQHLSHDYLDEEEEQQGFDLMWESLPLVGMVVMHFNVLEKQIDSAICEAISDRSDSMGLLVLHGMQYNSKVEMFKRFCEDLHLCVPDGAPQEYEGVIDYLTEAARLRNLVVHADWFNTDKEGYTYSRLKLTKGGMQQEYVQLTPNSLEEIVERILVAQSALDRYWEQRSVLLHGR